MNYYEMNEMNWQVEQEMMEWLAEHPEKLEEEEA